MRFDVNGIPIHCPEGVDSTIAPPQNQRFSSKSVSWPLHTRKDAMKNMSSRIGLFAKDYHTINGVWVGRSTALREVRPGAGFKARNFVEQSPGTIPQSDCKVNANADGNDISPNR